MEPETTQPPPLPRRDATNPPPEPRDAPENRPETSGAPSGAPEALTVTDTVPEAPRAPGLSIPAGPLDLWRDRLRVVFDRAIYLLVAWIAYRLRMADKLDYGTGAFLLLLAGVRAQNLADFLVTRAATNPASRAAVVLGALGIHGTAAESFRGLFRG